MVHWDRQPPGVRYDYADRLVDLYASGEQRIYGPFFLQRKMNISNRAFSNGDFSLFISSLQVCERVQLGRAVTVRPFVHFGWCWQARVLVFPEHMEVSSAMRLKRYCSDGKMRFGSCCNLSNDVSNRANKPVCLSV